VIGLRRWTFPRPNRGPKLRIGSHGIDHL
jgi:hypothetical protein